MKTKILLLLCFCCLLDTIPGYASGILELRAKAETELLPLEYIIRSQIRKNGHSSVDLYTSSKDPQGMLALQVIIPAIRKLDRPVPLTIYYSLEPDSPAEAIENFRQMAIRELYPEKFHEYLLLRSQDLSSDDWITAARSLGLETERIQLKIDKIAKTHTYEKDEANDGPRKTSGLYVGGHSVDPDSPYLFGMTSQDCCEYSSCISNCLTEKGVEFSDVELMGVILLIGDCFVKPPKKKKDIIACLFNTIVVELDEHTMEDIIDLSTCLTDCRLQPCSYNADSYTCDENEYCASYSIITDGTVSNDPFDPPTNDAGTRYIECVDCPTMNLTPQELNVTVGQRIDGGLVYALSEAYYSLEITRVGQDGSYNIYTENHEKSLSGPITNFANFTIHFGDQVCATITGEAGMYVCPQYQECYNVECPEIIFWAANGFLNIRIDASPVTSRIGYEVFDPTGTVIHSEITPFLTETYYHSIPITQTGEYGLSYNVLQDIAIPEPNCPPGRVGVNVSVCDLANAKPKVDMIDVYAESAPGNADGTAVVTMDDAYGLTPFTFLWSNGSTNKNLDNVPAGAYSLIITDANGCATTVGTEIPMNGVECEEEGLQRRSAGCEEIIVEIIPQNSSYPHTSDGSIDVQVNGMGTFYYYWTDLPGTLNLSYRDHLPTGTYCVTVYSDNFDPDCCYREYCVTIEADCTISLDLQTDYCPRGSLGTGLGGGGNGSPAIFASVENVVAPLNFSWSNGATTQEISNLSPGNYTVTVSDADGCVAVATKKILGGYTPLTASQQLTRHCNGLGDIQVFPSGGGGVYEYAWSNGATTRDLINVEAGTYNLVITDSYGCTLSREITLTPDANALLVDLEAIAPCEGQNNGSINAIVNGGQTPYTFEWSNGANTQQLNQLTPNQYTLVVTDAAGCENVQVVELAVASPPAYEISTDPENGGIAIQLLETLDYAPNIRWNGPGLPAEGDESYQLSGLDPGIYCLEMSNESGCSFRECTQLFSPLSIHTQFRYECQGVTPAICVQVNGGSGSYDFEWLTYSNSSTCFENPIPGYEYCYRVVDLESGELEFDCLTYPLAENNPLEVTHEIGGIYCEPGQTAFACISVEGGYPPYTYSWNDGWTSECHSIVAGSISWVEVTDVCGQSIIHNLPSNQGGNANMQMIRVNDIRSNCTQELGSIIVTAEMSAPNNVLFSWTGPNDFWSYDQSLYNLTVPGNYTLRVINRCNGQEIYQETLVLEAINESDIAFELVPVDIQSACSNIPSGSINLEIDWDNPFNELPLIYEWSNGATTQDITGLQPGTYTVTVSSGECTVVESFIVEQQLEAIVDITDICGNGASGAFEITVTGNFTPPLLYEYDNLPTIGGFGTNAYDNLEPGIYNVTISDGSGCEHRRAIEIRNTPAPEITAEVSPACTNEGEIDLTLTPPPNIFVSSIYWLHPYSIESEDLSGASVGTARARIIYGVRGTTERCTMYYDVEVPSVLDLQFEVDRPCGIGEVGSIDLSVSGGTPPYSYSWSNGESTEDLTNISPGLYYTVTVTDASGCQTEKSILLQYQISNSTTVKHTCINSQNGTIELMPQGQYPPFTYLWSNGATTSKITNLSRGYYAVTITDATGCELVTGAIIQEDEVPFTASVTYPCNDDNGAIDLQLPSNSAPYITTWSNGATTEDLQELSPGNYTVTITNRNWCSTVETFELKSGGMELYIRDLSHNTSCFQKDQTVQNSDDGLITIDVINGMAPYTYLWSNGATTQTIDNLSPGFYTVTVTDVRGCTEVQSVNIKCCEQLIIEDGEGSQTSIDPLIVTAEVTPISTHGASDGRIVLTLTGGDNFGSIYWENEHGVYIGNTPVLNNLSYGVYTVRITDGCTVFEDSWPIRDCSTLEWDVDYTVNRPCYSPGGTQHNDGYIELDVRNGYGIVEPLTYSWESGETTDRIEFEPAGTYRVTITDKGGCTYTKSFNVTNEYAAGVNPYTCVIGEYCGDNLINSEGSGTAQIVFVNEDPNMQPQANPCASVMICTLDGSPFTGDILDAYSIDQEVVSYEDGLCIVKHLCELNIPFVGVQQKWTEPIFYANCCPNGQEVIEGSVTYEDCNSANEGNECVFDLYCSGDLSTPLTPEPICLTSPIRVIEDDPEQECLAIVLCGPGAGDEIPGVPIRQEIIDLDYDTKSCFAITLCEFILPSGFPVQRWNNTRRAVDCCPSGNIELVREATQANCNPADEDMECLISYFCEDSFFEEREFIYSECFDQGESPIPCNDESCVLEVSLEVDNFERVTAQVTGTGNFSYLWTFMDVDNGTTLSTHTGLSNQIYPEDLNPDLPTRFIVCVLVTDLDNEACFYASDCTIISRQALTDGGNQFGLQRNNSKPKEQLIQGAISPIRILPNPFSDYLNIRYESPKTEEIQIEMFNLIGERVYNSTKSIVKGVNQFRLDLPVDLASGIYTIRIESQGTAVYTENIVRMKP